MSKIVYVCYRNLNKLPEFASNVKLVAERILPDNIFPNPPKIFSDNGVAYGIFNPVDSIEVHDGSVVMGKLFQKGEWWKPLNSYPDGSYALFRQDGESIELVTDVVGSRTIWYFMNDDVFIASTSQRAIVIFLKEFKFNDSVISWVLSTGSLGPDLSWDSRIKMVPPDSSVLLNRGTWDLKIRTNEIFFEESELNDELHVAAFRKSITNTLRNLRLDFKKWVLPLSGGYDSRCILAVLDHIGLDIRELVTITWGLAKRRHKKGSDAEVAKKVADHFDLKNEFLLTNPTSEPLEKLIERFFVCGEGRIDHMAGYLDGFKVWKTLFECNVQGIIRGDVCLTSKPAENELYVRNWQGFSLCSEYSSLTEYERRLEQRVPEKFNRRSNESLEQWRDRLYQQFRIPVVLSALSDLKLCYVEVVNPLLSKGIVMKVRSLPDHLKNQKSIFKNYVKFLLPNIEIARDGATVDTSLIFNTKEMNNLLLNELQSAEATSIFSERFLEHIRMNLRENNAYDFNKSRAKSFLKRILPVWVKSKYTFAKKRKLNLSYDKIAFRIFTVIRMKKLFTQDAQLSDVKTPLNNEA